MFIRIVKYLIRNFSRQWISGICTKARNNNFISINWKSKTKTITYKRRYSVLGNWLIYKYFKLSGMTLLFAYLGLAEFATNCCPKFKITSFNATIFCLSFVGRCIPDCSKSNKNKPATWLSISFVGSLSPFVTASFRTSYNSQCVFNLK